MEMDMSAGMWNFVGTVLHLQEELLDLDGDRGHVRPRRAVLGHALQRLRPCQRGRSPLRRLLHGHQLQQQYAEQCDSRRIVVELGIHP